MDDTADSRGEVVLGALVVFEDCDRGAADFCRGFYECGQVGLQGAGENDGGVRRGGGGLHQPRQVVALSDETKVILYRKESSCTGAKDGLIIGENYFKDHVAYS